MTPRESLLRTQNIFLPPFPSALLVAGAFAMLFCCQPGYGATPDSSIAGQRWWSYVQHLASDGMEGRLTGSDGYRKAAQYVTEQFQASSLAPKGVSGYLQPVRFDVQRIQASQSSLTLLEKGQAHSLTLGQDALLGSRLPQPKTIQAPLVFVGYGLHLPEAHYDDLADQDLHGKIIVYLNGGPSQLASALKAHARAPQEFYRAVEKAGAVGILSIPNPKSMDIPWSRMALAASQPGMQLTDPSLQDTRGPMFTSTLNPAHASQIFAGSGHTWSELLALGDAGKPLPRFPLPISLRAHVSAVTEQVESPNVIGVLPGSDPQRQGEYVVLTAHLDHLGIGEPIGGDRIYNGAMDDASGVATLLDVARQLHEAHASLKRSVLFVVVCAEEKGLLGSRYFAGHPTVPARSLVADLNTDMFLPIIPLNNLTVYGLEESSLGEDVRAVAAGMDVKVLADAQPDRNIFIRSDQYNFIRAGVPSVMNAFAATPGTAEEKTMKDWLTNRYHAPSDDTNQPVDLVAAARFNRLLLALTERVANAEARPEWKQASFFKRFAIAHP
jgi:Zn-dependent M28 family amino/carboxypeptidase